MFLFYCWCGCTTLQDRHLMSNKPDHMLLFSKMMPVTASVSKVIRAFWRRTATCFPHTTKKHLTIITISQFEFYDAATAFFTKSCPAFYWNGYKSRKQARLCLYTAYMFTLPQSVRILNWHDVHWVVVIVGWFTIWRTGARTVLTTHWMFNKPV